MIGLRAYFLIKDKKYEEALAAVEGLNTKFAVFVRIHILQQMRQPERAVDILLDDLETWPLESIPDEYFLMLSKSVLSLKHAEKLSLLIEKCSQTVSAQVLMAYVDLLQAWKLDGKLPAVVENLLRLQPNNKQIQALYLEIFAKSDLNKATRL